MAIRYFSFMTSQLPKTSFYSPQSSTAGFIVPFCTSKGMQRTSRYCRNFSNNLHSEKLKKKKRYEALLLDAGGTLLETRSPVEETYASIGLKYRIGASPSEIKRGFKKAFAEPWPENWRYQGDGRPFWRHVVAQATGCTNDDYFEEVYKHFAQGSAWKIPEQAYEVLSKLRDSGVKLAVISNFDNRLRPIMEELNLANLFDAIIVSSEVGYEKPARQIFQIALGQLRVEANKAIHVGDDLRADKIGASAVGIDCWLWAKEIHNFEEILDRILVSETD